MKNKNGNNKNLLNIKLQTDIYHQSEYNNFRITKYMISFYYSSQL